jgi:hypothetical protein
MIVPRPPIAFDHSHFADRVTHPPYIALAFLMRRDHRRSLRTADRLRLRLACLLQLRDQEIVVFPRGGRHGRGEHADDLRTTAFRA